MESIINFSYIAASVLFIFGLKMLSSQKTAKRGNLLSAGGMLVAIVATLLKQEVIDFQWIIIGLIVGSLIGIFAARLVKMTSMPELVALFNGFGGIASLLVGWSEYHAHPESPLFTIIAILLAVIIGGVTFSGSIIAYAKLAEKIGGKPTSFKGQKVLNLLLLLGLLASGTFLGMDPADSYPLFIGILAAAVILGIFAVIPIGGADMPVVIALLNSYSGLAACAAGFVILNNVLIVAGSLVGASGLILTNIMCKAMNRSLANVLFAGVGATSSGGGDYQGEANPVSAEDAYYILEAANSVVFVPGYGMAVAQAQHVVRELAELLESNGTEVQFAIHPVAGRMPGHMNVLLAEANVSYEQLVIPEDVNPTMSTVDVTMVIGANDVVNPAARTDESSPLYGMPIIDVDQARTCIVLKRSLNPGFAGVDNPLFFREKTRMLFGDAKASISALVAEFKES
ncbi:MAG: NAD synthetase [Kiritimatiellae bacterium]|nr:NAD synthetase [Kiritimatiellia bacterium]